MINKIDRKINGIYAVNFDSIWRASNSNRGLAIIQLVAFNNTQGKRHNFVIWAPLEKNQKKGTPCYLEWKEVYTLASFARNAYLPLRKEAIISIFSGKFEKTKE